MQPTSGNRYLPTLQRVWKIGQVLLVPALFYVIYQQVIPRFDWAVWQENLRLSWQSGQWVCLLAVLLLLPLNWLLETAKWRTLLGPAIQLPLGAAYRAVLRGVTISLFTPNRIGEYGGRILTAAPGQHWAFIRATLWGSLAQWLILLAIGWPALLYVARPWLGWSSSTVLLWHLPGLLLVAGLTTLYLWPAPLLQKLKFSQGYGRRIRQLWHRYVDSSATSVTVPSAPVATAHATCLRRVRALVLAGLRYAVYSGQYLLLLYFFGLTISPLEGLLGISAIFLVQAGLPMPPGLALLLRSELALLVWPLATPAIPVAATLALFIINLVIPALLGVVFIVTISDAKSLTYVQPHDA